MCKDIHLPGRAVRCRTNMDHTYVHNIHFMSSWSLVDIPICRDFEIMGGGSLGHVGSSMTCPPVMRTDTDICLYTKIICDIRPGLGAYQHIPLGAYQGKNISAVGGISVT